MTVTLERYVDARGLYAEITQDKYSAVYQMRTFEMIDESRAQVLYENTYLTIPNARRALRRQLTKPITLEYKAGH